MQLVWTPESVEDREAIYAFIELDNPRAALALDTLISEKAERLLEQPGLGRPGRVPGTRELVLHPNYLLIYHQVEDRLRILRLLNAARQWPRN
jgi:addiction module RelE/StbE family toxin